MNKFLKKCGLFTLVIIILNIIYLVVLTLYSPGFKKVYEISKFENENYQLVVLGNSMALDGIDTGYLSKKGINSFNLAIAGDHIATSQMILERYLKNNSKPKYVVIGISSAIGNAFLNKVSFKNPEVEFFYNPELKATIINPPLLNFQWLFVDLLKIIISKDHREATLTRGQWKTQKVIADNSKFKEHIQVPIDYKNPHLLKIVELCENQNIKLIITELPGSNNNRNSLPFQYDATLLNNKKVKIYNLNNNEVSSRILDPSKDWLAPDHLNKFGAEKVTAYLYENVIKKEYQK